MTVQMRIPTDAVDSQAKARFLASRQEIVAEAVAIGEAEQRTGLRFVVDRHRGLTGIVLPSGVELAVRIARAEDVGWARFGTCRRCGLAVKLRGDAMDGWHVDPQKLRRCGATGDEFDR